MGYKPWEIDLLDPWDIQNIIFWPRDEKGELKPFPDAAIKQTPEQSRQAFFFEWYFRRGYPKWQIEKLWQEAEEKRRQKAKAKKGGTNGRRAKSNGKG